MSVSCDSCMPASDTAPLFGLGVITRPPTLPTQAEYIISTQGAQRMLNLGCETERVTNDNMWPSRA